MPGDGRQLVFAGQTLNFSWAVVLVTLCNLNLILVKHQGIWIIVLVISKVLLLFTLLFYNF